MPKPLAVSSLAACLTVNQSESRMPEIGTFGLMSGDGKRSVGHRPQATAPILNSTIASVRGNEAFRSLSERSGH